MHAHLESVFRRFDEAHAALRTAVNAVPDGVMTARPGSDRWSVAEVLEHLALVESTFACRMGEAIAAAAAAGLGPERAERVPLPESLAAILANRSKRRDAPQAVRPTGRLDPARAWAAVERTRDEVRDALTQADGRALSTVTYPHPFFGSLTAYQWVELLAAHRDRHTMQIREAVAQLT
jgi:hypothetical protein